jgi:hypothetical protein
MPQVIEGTTEEIVNLLRGGAFAGRKARLIFEQDDEDSLADLPDPPNTVRSAAHLEQLLLEGLASPAHEVTPETWEHVRAEVRRRHETRTATQ